MIQGIAFDAMLAKEAFDSNWIIEDMTERAAKTVISQRPQRLRPMAIDVEMYKRRHLIENFFCDRKGFNRIATRSDKTDTVFSEMIYAVGALINGR